MATWAISVAGIILLTVLCDVIIPEGQTNKYIKTVTSIIAIVVMISPLPKIVNGDFAFEVNSQVESNYQQDYLDYVYAEQVLAIAERTESHLDANGFSNVEVKVMYSKINNALNIDKVLVNIKNIVLKDKDKNINIVEEITTMVAKILGVEEGRIIIYE